MKNLFSFLEQLEANNRKERMDANRSTYKEVREDFIDFVQELIDRRAEYDKQLECYEPKHCMFRINRNIRFSKDKRPYKGFMAAVFAVE